MRLPLRFRSARRQRTTRFSSTATRVWVKTHLMYAIANVLRRTHPEYRIIYVKGEDFTNELITAIQEGNVQAFRNKYRMVDLLLLTTCSSSPARAHAGGIFPYL